MGTDSRRASARVGEEETQSEDDSDAGRKADGSETQQGNAQVARHISAEPLQRAPTGAAETPTWRGGAPQAGGTVPYEPGPDPESLSNRYGMAVDGGEATRLQRLEESHGVQRVSEWAEEGMTVETMAKPRDMAAFRRRQTGRPAEVPTDIERRNEKSAKRNAAHNREEGSAGDAGAPDIVRDVVSSPGRSMDDSVQREMESKMGGSFDDVQLHTGPKATAAADSINARAFTVGNHVAFNSGEYNPGSDSGKTVLAHELTHVRQQTDGRVSMLPKAEAEHPGVDSTEGGVVQRQGAEMVVQPKLEVSSPDDPAEKEAERVAEQVVQIDEESATGETGEEVGPALQRAPAVQRQPADGKPKTYKVKRGDSLIGIANKFDIEGGGMAGAKQIAEWNSMAVSDVIHPEETLKLSKEASSDQGGGTGSGSEGRGASGGEATASDGGATESGGEAAEGGGGADSGGINEGELFNALREAADQGVETYEAVVSYTADAVGAGVDAVEQTLTQWERVVNTFFDFSGEEQAEEGTKQEAPDVTAEDLAGGGGKEQKEKQGDKHWSTISETINRETQEYKNLAVDIGGEKPIKVEASYFINTADRGEEHARREKRGGSAWFSDWGEKNIKYNKLDSPERFKTGSGGDLSQGRAVEVGKASPDALENFLQEAWKDGLIQEHAGGSENLGPENRDATRQAIQNYVDDVGIGVDCSGLVTNMIAEILNNMGGDGGEVRSIGAQSRRDKEITDVTNVRPGDLIIGVNKDSYNHVVMVQAVSESDEAKRTIKTVESTSGDAIDENTYHVDSISGLISKANVNHDENGVYRSSQLQK